MKAREQKEIVTTARATSTGPVWEQRPRETGRAYDYFLAYREMGLQRSYSGLAKLFGTSYINIRKIANRNDWDIRVAAWDAKLAMARDEAAMAEAKRMGERHARLGMKMQSIGSARLDQFVTSPELSATLTAQDTIRLVKEGTEIERAARGDDPDKGKQGNIIFNINMAQAPKWAPKDIKVIEGEVAIGPDDQSK